MRIEKAEGEATVKDFSGGKDGSTNVDVKYPYEFKIFETKADVDKEYSENDLIALANAREKATANSGARQKAVAPYAQDPNSPAAMREALIKQVLKMHKNMTDEQAAAFVDSLAAA